MSQPIGQPIGFSPEGHLIYVKLDGTIVKVPYQPPSPSEAASTSAPEQPIGISPEGYPVYVKPSGTVMKATPQGKEVIGKAKPPTVKPPSMKSFFRFLLETKPPSDFPTKAKPKRTSKAEAKQPEWAASLSGQLLQRAKRLERFREIFSVIGGKTPLEGLPKPESLKITAAMVAGVEEPAYELSRLLGFKPPKVPPLSADPLYAAGRIGFSAATIAAGTYFAGAIGIPVTLKSVAAGAGLSLGASEAFKLATTGKHLTAEEAFKTAEAGAALTIAGAGYFKGLSKVAPVVGSRSLAGSLSRVAAASAFSGASSYVLSKGDVEAALVAAGLGAAVAGGIEVGAAKITPAAERWLTSRYLKSMEKGKLAWAGWKEKAVMKLTGAKPYVPRNIQVVPDFPYPRADVLYKQIVSWEFAETPGTSMLLPSKYPEIPSTKAWVEAHVFKKPPTGGLLTAQQLMKEIQLIEHAAKSGVYMPGLPYIPPPPTPSLPSSATSVSVAGASAGVSLLTEPEAIPKRPERKRKVSPSYVKQKAKHIQRLKQIRRQKRESELDLMRLVFQETRQKQKQKQTTVVIQRLRLKQKQISPPSPLPSLLKPESVFPPGVGLPASLRGKPKKTHETLWGRWFMREHRLPTARDIAKALFGTKKKKKSGKRKAKKKRKTKGAPALPIKLPAIKITL